VEVTSGGGSKILIVAGEEIGEVGETCSFELRKGTTARCVPTERNEKSTLIRKRRKLTQSGNKKERWEWGGEVSLHRENLLQGVKAAFQKILEKRLRRN